MDKGIWKFLKAQFTIPLINVMTINTYVKKKKKCNLKHSKLFISSTLPSCQYQRSHPPTLCPNNMSIPSNAMNSDVVQTYVVQVYKSMCTPDTIHSALEFSAVKCLWLVIYFHNGSQY